MMWGYNGYGLWGGGMGLGMLLFWGLIIAAIVVLVRGFGARPGGGEARLREKTALDILGERYAKGEIDKAEFEQKRGDLGAG
ncbi:MAG: SHOCT domain-containing protein [Burkholderiales bacterium]